MSDLMTDNYYARILCSQYKLFKQTKPYHYNFRCPLCGDSKKDEKKARGNVYVVKNVMRFGCFNCGRNMRFSLFLKQEDEALYKEYLFETFEPYRKQVIKKQKTHVEKQEKYSLDDVPVIHDLEITHPARKYIEERKIPQRFYKYFCYTDNFQLWIKNCFGKVYGEPKYDPRIIIPCYNEQNELIAVQGRSLLKKTSVKYMNIKLNEMYNSCIFGLDRINLDNVVFVVEGAIDSLYVNNCLAVSNANLTSINSLKIAKRVFVWDNDKRNREICRYIERAIDDGEVVVIWPDDVIEKDINSMVTHGNYTQYSIMDIIKNNMYKGLRAKIELDRWKRI